ncbi:hypothetical protein [Flammeovirga sp. SJP92]|uniref:hypothetical protein n=1 Tax=Flammeovirga sp. SJP92 TaxID=1775430 RepID=UPI000787EB3A|nr:hypothetical protein [Flammeovirga sp. SJP92]KXX70775.1 hypothetical protein AVL50_07145 [Flammeovirga sp. SJP92]
MQRFIEVLIRLVKEIVNREIPNTHLYHADVTEVNLEAKTCTVETDDEVIEDVKLGAVEGTLNGCIVIPTLHSTVIVGVIDGDIRTSCILKYSSVEQIHFQSGIYTLLKGAETVKQLEILDKRITAIEQGIQTAKIGVQDGGFSFKTDLTASLSQSKSDLNNLENKDFTHGI